MTLTDKPALILIDIQKGFEGTDYWGGHRNNVEAELNAAKLLQVWRQHNLPIFHIKHCSNNPKSPLAEGTPGNEFQNHVKPLEDESVIKKHVNSAFIGTSLKEQLDKREISKLVMVGLTTDHCVSTTTRMAANYGYETFIVSDATATFDRVSANGQKYPAELIHETALASLHNEFATIITTNELVNYFS